MKRFFLTAFLSCLFVSTARAEEHNHADANAELGVSIGSTYILNEGFGASVHTHLSWFISDRVSVGVGYERLFDAHKHNTVSLVSQLHLLPCWQFALAPGFSLSDDGDELSAALHVETFYEIPVTDYYHLGPAFEIALDRYSAHITLGLHSGIEF